MSEWARVNKQHPCPVCGKGDYCTVSDDGVMVKCMRISDGAFKSEEDGSGLAHFHKLREPLATLPKPADAPPEIDAEKLARQASKHITDRMVSTEARKLGVSIQSLADLRIGWARQSKAFTFPMRDDQDKIIGIRLRSTDGKKWAVPGSKNGLFIPRKLTGAEPLFVVEGPTDCAALLTLGLDVIGRPSDTAGTDLIAWWTGRHGYTHVIIALENNEPGSMADVNALRGAGALKYRLLERESINTATVMKVPGAKDVREWLQQGGKKGDVLKEARKALKEQNGAGAKASAAG